MARYRALELGHCGRQLRQEGEEFDYEGEPGLWMQPVCAAAKKAKAAADEKLPPDLKKAQAAKLERLKDKKVEEKSGPSSERPIPPGDSESVI